MKTAILALALLIGGCASDLHTYKFPVGEIVNFYEIKYMDLSGEIYTIFSFMRPNGFYKKVDDSSYVVVFYVQDVCGQEFYIEKVNSIAFDGYNRRETHPFIFLTKQNQMIQYYYR